jgi:hypothetical protein
MRNERGEVHTDGDEARAGSTPHVVRWILVISTLAAIVLLSAVWMFGAATQGDIEEEANVSNMVRDTEAADADRSDIDGVVSQDADRFAPATREDMIQNTEANPERTVEN